MMRVANHLKTVGCCLKRLDQLKVLAKAKTINNEPPVITVDYFACAPEKHRIVKFLYFLFIENNYFKPTKILNPPKMSNMRLVEGKLNGCRLAVAVFYSVEKFDKKYLEEIKKAIKTDSQIKYHFDYYKLIGLRKENAIIAGVGSLLILMVGIPGVICQIYRIRLIIATKRNDEKAIEKYERKYEFWENVVEITSAIFMFVVFIVFLILYLLLLCANSAKRKYYDN